MMIMEKKMNKTIKTKKTETEPKKEVAKTKAKEEKEQKIGERTEMKTKTVQNKETQELNKKLILPVAPLKEGTVFPGLQTRMLFSRELSKKALRASAKTKNLVFILAQKDNKVEQPKAEDLYKVGVIIETKHLEETENGIMVDFRAVNRAKIKSWVHQDEILITEVELLEDVEDLSGEELKIMSNRLLDLFMQLVKLGSVNNSEDFLRFLRQVPPGEVADHITNVLTASTEKKQKILETLEVSKRLYLVLEQLETELQIVQVEKSVIAKTNAKFEQNMKESILRERLQMIQKELGDTDDDGEVADEYNKQLEKLETTTENKNKITKELKRFRQTHSMSPESGYLRSWLDTVFELPWGKYSQDKLNIKEANKILDESHYALREVKDRILEYIAVLELRQRRQKEAKAPTILCFVGPPGVGKTSIGKSIAKALGRKFTKISLGGVHDEAEIRGHRRTYVGAMAGRIIEGLKQAGTANPVFMLDEIDKMASDYKGDPSSALLEVLDPAQNENFEDHYLDMPFDLSQVIFIATANTLNIPTPLLDRMEIIRYSGYTTDEKEMIAQKYLLPMAIEESGLTDEQVEIKLPILTRIIERYTREAGVRELGRQLDKVMRKTAKEILLKPKIKKVSIDQSKLTNFLGAPKYDVSLQNQKSEVGVATGLAWTSVGGDVLFIEVALAPGKGCVKLTGKLGDVMKESAQAAHTFIRTNAEKFDIDRKKADLLDIHIHVPEGAVPKDGPSAGVTIVTALVSAMTGRPVKKDVAMTGEVNLRGQVLRIGGLKEKAIAAHRAGCKTVLIPWDNRRDLPEIPEKIRKEIQFVPTKTVFENLKWALETNPKRLAKKKQQAD